MIESAMKSIATHIALWLYDVCKPTVYCKEFQFGDKHAYVSRHTQRISDSLYSKKERITPSAEYIEICNYACYVIIDGIAYFVSI